MKKTRYRPALFLVLLVSCSAPEVQTENNLFQQTSLLPALEGKKQYLASPFVAAGDRVYMVGHQDGSFPDIGWHVTGEMGGIWDHPIKLMDGFSANISLKGGTHSFCLDNANLFVNYPIGNRHHYGWDSENITIDRFQFVPDGVEGMIIEFRINNNGSKDKELVFAFTGKTDLRPTWLGERTNMNDGEDVVSYDEKLSAVIAKDKNNPWFTAFGSSRPSDRFSNEINACGIPKSNGLGNNGTLFYSIRVKPNEEKIIPIFIAGSYQSEEALRSTYSLLKNEGTVKLKEKINRFATIDNASHLTIPDKGIEQMYQWLKYNTDWLVRNVPEQGVGISAGLPDYPWWFGADMTYALQGVLATGNHDLAKSSIMLLHSISQKTNNNGRIIHEVSTNGSVYNPGNVNETAQFITLLLNYYQWTGDKELITQLFPDVKKGITWLSNEMDPDHNGYPNGNGMMEIPGLDSEMIDVVVYTQQALASAAELSRVMGDSVSASEYRKFSDKLKTKINAEWWQQRDHSFGDFRGTATEAKPILEAALVRADTLGKPWAVAELKETKMKMNMDASNQSVPHVIYHNWVVNTPMETGVADREKALAALQTAKKYENPFGGYVTGIDRTEEPDSVVLKSRKKTFSYTGAVMTLPTGVLAIGSAKYGKTEDALRYLTMLHQSFSYALPGSMYEVSPDFGMITQAWNIYGVAVPIVNYFFGIQPKAYEKTIYLSPNLPLAWKEASLDRVRIGNNKLSISMHQGDNFKEYRIQQTQSDWNLKVDVSNAKKVMVDNKEIDLKTVGKSLTLKGKINTLRLY